jgi:hypothetical protein
MVPYVDEYALIHHKHPSSAEDHNLCGPLAFCCQRSADLFNQRFSQNALIGARWAATDGRQIVMWMDAGVQVIYFIYCLANAPDDLVALALSGDDARQVLLCKRPLDALPIGISLAASNRLLDEIAADGEQGDYVEAK